jgi:hypothetical protein
MRTRHRTEPEDLRAAAELPARCQEAQRIDDWRVSEFSQPAHFVTALQPWARLLTGQCHAHARCASLPDGAPADHRHAGATFRGHASRSLTELNPYVPDLTLTCEAGSPSLLSPVGRRSGCMRAREGGPVMPVYAGFGVHRMRSQVAVIDQSRGAREPQCAQRDQHDPGRDRWFAGGYPGRVRGRVRRGMAGRAAGGLRFRPASGAPAAGRGHRLSQIEGRQGPARGSWRSCCGRFCATGYPRCWPATAMTGRAAAGAARAAPGWRRWTCQRSPAR